jgi:hypothetical protein
MLIFHAEIGEALMTKDQKDKAKAVADDKPWKNMLIAYAKGHRYKGKQTTLLQAATSISLTTSFDAEVDTA